MVVGKGERNKRAGRGVKRGMGVGWEIRFSCDFVNLFDLPCNRFTVKRGAGSAGLTVITDPLANKGT